MQIQNLLTLLLFLVGTTTYAQDAAVKNDLFKCRSYFNTSVTPGNQDVSKADAYCKGIMSANVFCAEQELIKTMAKVSLTQDQITAFRAQYQNKCATASTASATGSAQAGQLTYAQGAQQAQLQQAQAAAAAAAAAKQNQASAAQQQADSKANLQQGVQLLGAAANIAEKVEGAYDKAAKGAAPKEAGKVETAPDAQKASGPAAAPAAGGSATESGFAGLPSSGGGSGTGAVAAGATGTAAAGAPAAAAAQPDYGNMSEADFAAAMKKEQMATDVATGKVPAEAAAVKSEMPAVAGPVGQAENAVATGAKVEPPPSVHTTNAKTADGELKTKLTAAASKAKPILTVASPALPFSSTATMLDTNTQQAHTSYTEGVKPSCITLTEKTEFLCMEGSSPGAVAAKELVSAAGPVLAAVNSAQKACSNTSKITGLAGTVLTVAKGVCMASQAACTMTCGAALTKWNGSVAQLVASIQTQAQADASLAETDCYEKAEMAGEAAAASSMGTGYMPAFQASYGPCKADIAKKAAAVKAAIGEIQVAAKTEAVPATAGTSAGLAAKCKLKIKDALLMAVNIGSLMMAKKNADECDKKLSSTGVAGGGATVAQYCEKPENTSTQFCKCQKTPSAEGCPGFTASTSTVDQAKEDQKGLDVKGLAGGKALFAGGTNSNFKPDGTFAGGAAGSTASGDSSLSLESTSASGATGSAAGATAGAPGGPSANGGRPSDGSAPEREKKKWDFGSFAASIGGMFGGSKSGSKSNGSLSSNQKNAIERKIASDKLSAEISSASGKSNWEKVKQAYLIKENTLLSGQ